MTDSVALASLTEPVVELKQFIHSRTDGIDWQPINHAVIMPSLAATTPHHGAVAARTRRDLFETIAVAHARQAPSARRRASSVPSAIAAVSTSVNELRVVGTRRRRGIRRVIDVARRGAHGESATTTERDRGSSLSHRSCRGSGHGAEAIRDG